MKQKFKMSGGILICIILITLLMGNTTVFAETRTLPEEYYDLPSVKVFGMYNGEGVTDFICFTESYGGSKIRAEKQVGQNYAVVYYEKGAKGKVYLSPTGYEHIAFTEVPIDFNKGKVSNGESDAESIIVTFHEPIFEIPLFGSEGTLIDNVDYSHYHAKTGKTEDDPWVSEIVNVSKDGYINLQPLEAGNYWLEVRSFSDQELNVPSRMLYSVTSKGEVKGLDDYLRYAKVDMEVSSEFKRGSDKYPYTTGFNLYKQGTDGIGGRTWIAAYSTREAMPALFSGLNDGTYDYRIGVKKEAENQEIYDYWGELTVKGEDYDFDLPAGCPVKLTINPVGGTAEVVESQIIEPESNNLIVSEQSLVLEYEEKLNFDKEKVILEFGDRVGQADETITLRNLNRSAYGDTIQTIKMPYSVKTVSPIYEVVTTENGSDLSYDITIPMTTNVVTNQYKVIGYGYDSVLKEWEPLASIIDTTKGTVKMACKNYSVFMLGEGSPLFYDLTNYEWARSSIEVLAARNTVRGYDDGSYKPEKLVTKAEFITMIVNALQLKGREDLIMDDTNNKWYEKYMSIALDYKLVEATDNKVYPEQALNREEMATILANVMKLYPSTDFLAEEIAFSDEGSISSWAVSGVTLSQKYGLMNGKGTGFYPKDNTNRAEAARVIYQLSIITKLLN